MKVGLIGCGAWGKNYLRILNELKVEYGVLDPAYPDTPFTTLKDMIAWCDAAIVATPASTHAEIACELLEAGKHVLVEKPMANTLRSANRMSRAAEQSGVFLMVSNPFGYRGLELPCCGEDVRYMQARWTNEGRRRYDVGVAWDMAPHPMFIAFRAMNGTVPESQWFERFDNESVLSLRWTSVVCDIVVSWNQPRSRTMTFASRTGIHCVDYDKHSNVGEEPLLTQVQRFFEGCSKVELIDNNVNISLWIVECLEKAGC